tara:strand:+ start:906 stop:1922 length:1017 start_codon:yes stop_codon:yes gene_type:complete
MNKIKTLKVGVIGLGVGAHHLKNYLNNINCEVCSVCDFDKKKLIMYKKIYKKLNFYENVEDIFKSQKLDIISIASFDNYHYEQIAQSIKNNINIFIEKPLCLNRKELSSIIKLSKKNPHLVISSNMVLRCNPRFQHLRKLYKSKKFQDLYFIESDYYWGRAFKLSQWRAKIDNYSIILGAAIHLIDLILWVIGQKPTHVEAIGNRVGHESKMIKSNLFSSINLIFKNNLIVNIKSHGLAPHPHFHSLKFYSKNKTFIHQFDEAFIINKSNIKKVHKIDKPYPYKKNRSKALDSFVNKVLRKKESYDLVTFDEIINVMSICLSAIDSEKSGKRLKIKYY